MSSHVDLGHQSEGSPIGLYIDPANFRCQPRGFRVRYFQEILWETTFIFLTVSALTVCRTNKRSSWAVLLPLQFVYPFQCIQFVKGLVVPPVWNFDDLSCLPNTTGQYWYKTVFE